jgi:hypothetical protein
MEKDFIPYEEALALKELGFDEPCFAVYFNTTQQLYFDKYINEFNKDVRTLAPTFSQAFRWFRENHNLRCQINYIGGLINKTTWWDISVIGHYNTDPKQWEMKYQPYEEAELACLKKLIEIVNGKQ